MKKKESGRAYEDEGLQALEEAEGGRRKRSRPFLLWWLFLVLPLYLADQLTKWLVCREVEVGTGFAVIPGFFDIIHVRNTGAAFGILRDIPEPVRTYFFLGITIIALVAIFTIFSRIREQSRFFKAVLCLIVAGAVGNLTDRFLFGEVVDFLSFYIGRFRWPTFNLADTYISLGMAGLLVTVLFMPREKE